MSNATPTVTDTILAVIPRSVGTIEIVHRKFGSSESLCLLAVRPGHSPFAIGIHRHAVGVLRAALDAFEERMRANADAPAATPRHVPRPADPFALRPPGVPRGRVTPP
jgi:hypothetical protein